MQFNSFEFLLFFPIAYIGYHYVFNRNLRLQNIFLVVSSYFFYGWWDWRFLALIFISTISDYLIGIQIHKQDIPGKRKAFLILSLLINLGILGFFKYSNFFINSFIAAFSFLGKDISYNSLKLILPVGISFYTFQTLSYTIDIYYKKLAPTRNIIGFFAFVSFFPQLVAGPIERAKNLLPQILNKRERPDIEAVKHASWLVIWGLFLKLYLADNLGIIVDEIYTNYTNLSGFDIILGHYAFAFQIYGDFAGYTFIAIGVAKFFGISLNNNFLFPYFVKDPSSFWKNWHISLSSWLRDYLYIPLGGNRKGKWLTRRNLLLTMLLGGLWHGASWNFVIWGLYQGIILIIFRNIQWNQAKSRLIHLLQIFIMFNLTCLGWVFFRIPEIEYLGVFITQTINNPFSISYATINWIVMSLFYVIPVLLILVIQHRRKDSQYNPFAGKPLAMAILILALLLFGNYATKGFIYFQF